MDLSGFVGQWKGKEVVAFCGPIKYRGILADILEGGYLVMNSVAVMNPAAGELSEYKNCVLNMAEVSGLVNEETVGRGGDEY